MSDEGMLFGDMPVAKSPRLKWIERHGMHLEPLENESPEYGDGNVWKAWNNHTQACYGTTQDDALAAWARANGARMWFEEGV